MTRADIMRDVRQFLGGYRKRIHTSDDSKMLLEAMAACTAALYAAHHLMHTDTLVFEALTNAVINGMDEYRESSTFN